MAHDNNYDIDKEGKYKYDTCLASERERRRERVREAARGKLF